MNTKLNKLLSIKLSGLDFAQQYINIGSSIATEIGISLDSSIILDYNTKMTSLIKDGASLTKYLISSKEDLASLICIAAEITPTSVELEILAKYDKYVVYTIRLIVSCADAIRQRIEEGVITTALSF